MRKFTPENRVAIYERIALGLSLEQVSREVGVRHETFKAWLRRGREGEAEYREFANVVDTLRDLDREDELLDVEGLQRAVSKSARKGSISAQKLYWEILKNGDSGSGEQKDPLGGVDQLAQRRRARAG